jgi:hypothetical protein
MSEEGEMDEAVRVRLELLRREFDTGQQRLAEVETQRAQLTETLLRISGAIQVLEELTGEWSPDGEPQTPGNAVATGS